MVASSKLSLPMLAPILGQGSFDEGAHARFAGLLHSRARTGEALRRHWAELQAEVAETAEMRPWARGEDAGATQQKL